MSVRTLLAAGAAAAVLAGCAGSGIGVAARLGDDRISHDSLVGHVERGYVGAVTRQVDRVDLQRIWLSQLVKDKLYREAARRLGVMPSDAELERLVDERIQLEGGKERSEAQFAESGVSPADLRELLAAQVVYDLVADALVKDVPTTDARLREAYRQRLAQFDTAHIAHIKLKDKATADRVLAQIRAGADFALLAQQSIDAATAARGGDLGVIGNGPGPFDRAIVTAVFKARTGDVIGPIPVKDGFEIVRVVQRTTVPFEDARLFLRRGLLGEERDKRMKAHLSALAEELGISVNPRYGHWDDKEFRVVPGANDLSTTVPSPGVQQPAGPGGP